MRILNKTLVNNKREFYFFVYKNKMQNRKVIFVYKNNLTKIITKIIINIGDENVKKRDIFK